MVQRSRALTSAAVILMFVATTLMAGVSVVDAVTFDTFIYIAVAPDPVGAGQQVVVTSIMANVPPAQYPLDSPRYGYWENLTLTVWKPDGTTETKGPYRTGEAGSGYATYVPTQVGTYYFQWSFPGQTIEVGPRKGDYYRPSTSPRIALTVQQEKILPWPDIPLPTNYWETPIYGDIKGWSTIAGNWLAGETYRPSGDGFNPYATAPNSSHILWTRQEMFGGVAGAETGDMSAYTGRRPGEKFLPPVIISGRLYYNEPTFFGTFGAPSYNGFKCINLYTGETEWTTAPREGQYITMGQVHYFWSVAQEGVFMYLWETDGSEWSMYDAWTGRWILNVTGVLSGTNVLGPNGEILRYVLDGQRNWLAMWNSTKLLLTRMRAIGVAIDWTPVIGVYNFTDGIQWNVTLTGVPGNEAARIVTPDLVIARVFFPQTSTQPQTFRQDCAYSLKKGEEGRLLWVENRTVLDSNEDIVKYAEGVYISFARDKLQWYGYDAYTGRQLWVSEPFDTAFSMFSGRTDNTVIAYGKIFNTGYDGVVRALDLKTGKLLWRWYAGSSGLETPYGSWPLHGSYTGPRAADGKVFVLNSEHTPMANQWRGGKVYAIDAETGKEVWSIAGTQAEASPAAIAYGYLVYLNGYDGKVYCFGKGPSATTVTAPTVAVPKGTSVVIQGTVTDQSPAQKGTPCVAKESMTAWMEYLHMQRKIPDEVNGVSVKLSATGPDGRIIGIGTAITDGRSGVFGYAWTPPSEGMYKITASFEGDDSYGSSFATTYLLVSPAPSAIPSSVVSPSLSPSTTPYPSGTVSISPSVAPTVGAPSYDVYITAAVAASVIVIVLAALILKRRRQ